MQAGNCRYFVESSRISFQSEKVDDISHCVDDEGTFVDSGSVNEVPINR